MNDKSPAQKFLDRIRFEVEEQGLNVELLFEDVSHAVIDKINCNGYFSADDDSGILFVATGNPEEEWQEIMLHEYSHMQQWIEKCAVWRNTEIADNVDSIAIIDLWLCRHVELSDHQLRKYIQASINVEIDCERRTLKLIQEEDFPIDPAFYAQKSNAYILFYHMVEKWRRWYPPGRAPYKCPEIIGAMPTNLIDLDYTRYPEEFEELYLEHCLCTKPIETINDEP